MFAEALKLTAPAANRVPPLLEVFSAVYLLDSSVGHAADTLKDDFRRLGGDGAKAQAKSFCLQPVERVYETLRIRPTDAQPDQKMAGKIYAGRASGRLWIFDLGFFNALSCRDSKCFEFLSLSPGGLRKLIF